MYNKLFDRGLIIAMSILCFLLLLPQKIPKSPKAVSFGTKNYKIFWDTIIYGLLCLGMVYFNYQLFMRRKSYLS